MNPHPITPCRIGERRFWIRSLSQAYVTLADAEYSRAHVELAEANIRGIRPAYPKAEEVEALANARLADPLLADLACACGSPAFYAFPIGGGGWAGGCDRHDTRCAKCREIPWEDSEGVLQCSAADHAYIKAVAP